MEKTYVRFIVYYRYILHYSSHLAVAFQERFDQLNIAILNGVFILSRGFSQKLVNFLTFILKTGF